MHVDAWWGECGAGVMAPRGLAPRGWSTQHTSIMGGGRTLATTGIHYTALTDGAGQCGRISQRFMGGCLVDYVTSFEMIEW